MSLKLEALPLSVLQKKVEEAIKAWEDLKEASADAGEIKAAEKEYVRLGKECRVREEEQAKIKIKAEESSGKDSARAEKTAESHQMKVMLTTIQSLPRFGSGQDVHVWLNTLDAYYNLYVLKNGAPVPLFEGTFVQAAMGQICTEYMTPMVSGSAKITKYGDMKDHLKKHHSSKMSTYQVLYTVWNLQKTEVENLRDFGHRLDDKAAEAKSIIAAKFKAASSATPAPDISVDDVFKLVSGQVFLQYLKCEDAVIYNNIVNELDLTWTAGEIAIKAMSYSDRMVSDTAQYQAPAPPAAFNVGSPNQKSNKPCFKFLKGNCSKTNCRYSHDVCARDAYEQGLNENQTESANVVSQKKSKRQKGSVTYIVEDPPEGYDKVPMPLPDFRY